MDKDIRFERKEKRTELTESLTGVLKEDRSQAELKVESLKLKYNQRD